MNINIKDYTIKCTLYSGENSKVYKAYKDDEQYIIKEIEGFYLSELDLMSRIDHPNVLKYNEFLILPSTANKYINSLYFILPKATMTLEDYIRYKKLSFEDKLIIIHEILSGVDYVHRAGAYHCDIKPKNILMFGNRAVLSNFGLGLYFTTYFKKIICTSIYSSSPEWLVNNDTDGFFNSLKKLYPSLVKKYSFMSLEIWSLGVIIAFILTGKYIFSPEESKKNLKPQLLSNFEKYFKDPVKYLKDIGIEEEWLPLLLKILNTDQNKRVKTLNEIFTSQIFKVNNLSKPIQGKVINTLPFNITCTDIVKKQVYYIYEICNFHNARFIAFINAVYLFYQSYNYINPVGIDEYIHIYACISLSFKLHGPTQLQGSDFYEQVHKEISESKYDKKYNEIELKLILSLKGVLYTLTIFHYAYSKKSLEDLIYLLIDCKKFTNINTDIKKYVKELEDKETQEERMKRESKDIFLQDFPLKI